MRCPECGKTLTNEEDAYGHDCEVGLPKKKCECKGNRHTIECPIYGGLIYPPTPYHYYDSKTKKWKLKKVI
jgi:hypothetical protein